MISDLYVSGVARKKVKKRCVVEVFTVGGALCSQPSNNRQTIFKIGKGETC